MLVQASRPLRRMVIESMNCLGGRVTGERLPVRRAGNPGARQPTHARHVTHHPPVSG